MYLLKSAVVPVTFAFLAVAPLVSAQNSEVKLMISGPGAVNDSTIKAGQPLDIEVHCSSKVERTGYTLGLKFSSSSIKTLKHVADSGNGMDAAGSIKGYNFWKDKSFFDLDLGVKEQEWDGTMPEHLGFWGLSAKRSLPPIEMTKAFSIRIVVPDTGTIVVDSSFFPPAGSWMFAPPGDAPKWSGPYKYKVVK